MSRTIVNGTCSRLPAAAWSDPWGGGHDAPGVGGKPFAGVGTIEGNGPNVKGADPDTALPLIDLGRAFRAPHFHASWVQIPFAHVNEAELCYRIRLSESGIRAGLTRKAQAAPGP